MAISSSSSSSHNPSSLLVHVRNPGPRNRHLPRYFDLILSRAWDGGVFPRRFRLVRVRFELLVRGPSPSFWACVAATAVGVGAERFLVCFAEAAAATSMSLSRPVVEAMIDENFLLM
ncbi:hypothetical protein DFH11DRAFT_1549874 [Phellopilus nigrolimitatus]|nr:hypothetical protein DFH11DRAFT_1549874 [Phellopilus nigrolimitatus]